MMSGKHPHQRKPSYPEPSPFAHGALRRIEHDRSRDLGDIYFDICDLSDRIEESLAALPDGPALRTLHLLARLQALHVEHLFAESDLLHAVLRLHVQGRDLPSLFEDDPPQPP